MSKILVIGSSNIDLIAKVDRFPKAGETIEGQFFLQAFGGKGANQAVAAHRLGGDVSFITSLGSDPNGKATLNYFEQEGLRVKSALVADDVPSGTAMIVVNKEGENFIIITPGANNELTPAYIEAIEGEIANADVVVLQLEIPMPTVRKACELARRHGTEVILNAAPAREIDDDLLQMVDILVVNESEIEKLSGQKIDAVGEKGVMKALQARGARIIVLTLGSRGSIIGTESMQQHVPAFEVKAVDTTAAGDTFCGALVVRISSGEDIHDAVKFATAASAICVTRMGAQPSIPDILEVKQFFLSNRVTGLESGGEHTRSHDVR